MNNSKTTSWWSPPMQLLMCLFAFLLAGSSQASEENGVLGFWVMQDGAALLEISLELTGFNTEGSASPPGAADADASYQIRIVAIRDPIFTAADGGDLVGEFRNDIFNPEVKLRQRPLSGIVIGSGFKADGREWNGGRIYDPASGNAYKSELKLTDDGLLQVRGYLGVSLFGRTLYWHRAEPFYERIVRMFEHLN